MLRNYIGEDNFRKGIRNYYTKYFNSNTNTEEFKVEMEKVSGIDLDKFFDQWLYKGGNMLLDGNWEYDDNKKNIIIGLDQVQDDGFLFEMPIEIEIQYEDKRQNKFDKIVLDRKSKKFYINSKNRPVRIIIDPNTTLLAQWDFNEI
tara:strand:- start:178 stop:615 length:438 start_codon:yes stop_codon:yes gene_type:complete